MANEKKTETEKTEKIDYAEKFGGAVTLEKAERIFGKEKGLAAFQTAARIAGVGELKTPETQYFSLPGSDERLRDKINAALNKL